MNMKIPVDDETEKENEDSSTRIYEISSYGADYVVEDLVRRMQKKDFIVPEFQREDVWTVSQRSRFIESLLLGLPVPGIFVAKNEEKTHLVVDGQQRLRTLQYFLEEKLPPKSKRFQLSGVNNKWKGRIFTELSDADQRQLKDSIIHTTVFKQDRPSDDKNTSIYEVFERLNTGGTKLTPQEIRVALNGDSDLIRLLGKADENKSWHLLFQGKIARKSASLESRLKSKRQELILRFFALYSDRKNYKRTTMKGFLDRYCSAEKNMSDDKKEQLLELFQNTVGKLQKTGGSDMLRPKRTLNAAVLDSVMVGLAMRLQKHPVPNNHGIKRAYEKLLENESYIESCGTGTSQQEKVQNRIKTAIQAFKEVK